jgi:CheY-like chemotaxis protein
VPPDLPVLRCSLPSTRWITGHRHFDAMLTKPVSGTELMATLRALSPDGLPAEILAVDDDRSFIQLVARLVEAEAGPGIRVVPAYNGVDALRKARRLKPRVILLDLVMPEMGGLEVVEQLRQDPELKDTKVVAVSAASPGEDDLATRGVNFSVSTGGRRAQAMLLELIAATLGCAGGGSNGVSLPETG